jgi:cytochrome c oxidase subunit 2
LFVRALILPAVVLAAASMLAGCASKPPGIAHGKEIYDTCLPCHGSRGEGNLALRAPVIAGLPRWYVEEQLTKFKDGVRGAHPDDGEGARMRPMARSLWKEGDIRSVAEYVAGLPARSAAATLAGGDATAGRTRYNSICVACHGTDGKGNEALKAPNLLSQADWYMLAQLDKFKSGMRGAHPGDISGSQMRAMAMTLPDSQAMRDVVAYIRTLSQ